MSNGKTNTQLYDAIEKLRLEIKDDMISLRKEVDSNTTWRNQLTGKIFVMITVMGIGVNWAWDFFVNRN